MKKLLVSKMYRIKRSKTSYQKVFNYLLRYNIYSKCRGCSECSESSLKEGITPPRTEKSAPLAAERDLEPPMEI